VEAPGHPLAGRPGDALLERERELAAIAAALDTLRDGAGAAVVVEGPAGMGKSRLISEGLREAERRGVPVVAVRGSELTRDIPFGVLRTLVGEPLAGAEGEASQLAPLDRLLAPLENAGAAGAQLGDRGAALMLGLDRVVRLRVARGGSLVLAVDDVHWADPPSLRFLVHLGEQSEQLPIVLLLAVRSGEPDVRADLLARLRALPRARVLAPAPLTPGAVRELIRAGYDPDASEAFCAACGRVSGGNPFLLSELLAALRADAIAADDAGAERAGDLVPATVLQSLAVRLGRLGSEASALAGALAVLGDGAPLRRVAALAELAADEAERAADALAAAGLIGPGEPLGFVHPLIAAAIRKDMPGFARARAHRRAAALRAADGEPPDLVAAHLLAAPRDGDEWTVEQLRRAARIAVERGDPGTAARLLERALDEPPPAEHRADVLIELARSEVASGSQRAAEHLARGLELLDDGRGRAEALLSLARLYYVRVELAAARTAAERGLQELGFSELPGDEPEDALARELFGMVVAAGAIDLDAPAHVQELVGSLVEGAIGGRVFRGPNLTGLVSLHLSGFPEHAGRARELARAAVIAEAEVEGSARETGFASAAAALVFTDEPEAAEAAAEAVLERAAGEGDVVMVSAARCWLAVARHALGRLDEAAADAEASLELREVGWEGSAPIVIAVLAHVRIEQADLDGATEIIASAGPEPRELVLGARTRLNLLRGEHARALADALAVGEIFEDRYRSRSLAACPWRSYAALASLMLGRATEARRLAGEELELATRGTVARPIGVARRTLGMVEGGARGIELLRDAAATLAAGPAPLEHAWALFELGAALRRAGQRSAAREPLREALDVARRHGAALLAERARAELRAAGARPRRDALSGVDALTTSESHVARLAAAGRSNAEIAAELFLSRKTVEGHLSRAYRKLGVARREELAAALGVPGAA
jgi:DNA-binding CsgD family transcriptional regulator